LEPRVKDSLVHAQFLIGMSHLIHPLLRYLSPDMIEDDSTKHKCKSSKKSIYLAAREEKRE
jgi:hypothetical protein